MAAGKSTVGRLLASRFERGVHLEGDVFRRSIIGGREEMTRDGDRTVALALSVGRRGCRPRISKLATPLRERMSLLGLYSATTEL
jgi:hypothetical protein